MAVAAHLENASKVYRSGDTDIVALAPTTVAFNTGELTLLVGPSGSGKTTLLSLLGCVIYPTSGEVYVGDQKVSGLDEKTLAEIRLNHIGFVFQGFNLLAPLSALENVMQPLLLQGISRKEAKERVLPLIKEVNMEDRMYNLPKSLSGGQQQRIAIARALITNPQLLLCDEPTASLDHASTIHIMDTLKEITAQNRAVIVVTHDMRLKKYADRTIYVENGMISNRPIEEDF